MIVPHSQGKVINIQTNVFAFILSGCLTVGIVASFIYFNRHSISANMEISSLMNQNRETLAPLLFLPPIPPSIRVFSNESTLPMRWPKYKVEFQL